jgi:hypothetical protein
MAIAGLENPVLVVRGRKAAQPRAGRGRLRTRCLGKIEVSERTRAIRIDNLPDMTIASFETPMLVVAGPEAGLSFQAQKRAE